MDQLDPSVSPMNATSGDTHLGVTLMPSIGYTTIAIIMAVFCTLSVILNTTVILVTLRYRQLRQPINYSLVNLAIADLGVALVGGSLTVEANMLGYFHRGRAGCVAEGFFVSFFGIVALCTIAVIAVDRAIVVCKPMGMLTFTSKEAWVGVAVSWIWSLLWNIPPLFGWGNYQLEGIKTSCAPDWQNSDPVNVSYIVCYFLFCFAIPFFTILISYGYLLRTLRQVAKLGVARGGSTTKAEAQVAWMVLVMIMAFLICWLPYAAFAMVIVVYPQIYINPIIATIPMYMAKTSPVYNPIIYIFMNRQFRNCLMLCLLCGKNPWACEKRDEPDIEASTVAFSSSSRRGKVAPM
uniref:G-protein coupled receptors family 1 profile domain-containing protein n=1 Tax=Sphenodon punctatus TaxID=8508 RepID=A0A8D0HT49_SPHPU